MKHFIYADNAATTKLDKDAFNAKEINGIKTKDFIFTKDTA